MRGLLTTTAVIIGAEVALAAILTTGVALGHGTAYADEVTTLTVDGTDYPVCAVEDCSDQPGQIGVWIDPDTGNHWLSIGEQSYQVVQR